MIAGCPKCSARYRVDLDQIGEDGAKLRCTKCSAVFLVRAPRSTPSNASDAPPAKTAEQPVAPEAPARVAAAQPPAASVGDLDPSTLILIADSIEERGKQTASVIESWGLSPILVHDGVEAMLEIQRKLPHFVVLDAALPKMFGFQVCEIVKRNDSLRHITVVLAGAIHHQDRYRRLPSDLYGADVYLEQQDLPDGLLPLLRDAGKSSSQSSPPAPEPQAPSVMESPTSMDSAAPSVSSPPAAVPEPELAPAVTVIEQFATPAPTEVVADSIDATQAESAKERVVEGNPELSDERERAERLARIAVSEMLLYQPEKFDQAIRDGNIEAVLDLEIQEARALIRQRISEEVRAEKDFILDELERVARERSAAS